MLEIQLIRDNPGKVKKGIQSKGYDPKLVDDVLSLLQKRNTFITQVQDLRSERNKVAKEGKASERGKEIKEELKSKEPELAKLESKYKEALYKIPNLPAHDVPVGKDESENKVIRSWGEPTKFDFQPKNHLELGEALDIIDVKRASKVSGTRFNYLKGDAALLQFALVQLAMETLTKEGFIPVIPPAFITKDSMQSMGYMEHGGADEMYIFDKDNLVLIGTSEQAIGPMHKDEVINVKNPLRYVGFSPCFRREAGSYGKDTKGMFRLHQFNKVEMFSFTRPEDSDKEHEYLLSLEEKLFQALEIPYQVVKMCTGDLGAPAARKYDIEAWIPSENKYREVTSTSTTTDFQSRRLNIKHQDGGKKEFVNMLNGTAFSDRPIIAILENNQQKDGSVTIPKVLQEYLGKDTITLL